MVNIRNDAWLISKGAIEHLISIYRTHVTVFPRHSLKKRLSMAGSPFCWTVAVTSTCFVDVMPQLHSSYLVGGFNLSEKYFTSHSSYTWHCSCRYFLNELSIHATLQSINCYHQRYPASLLLSAFAAFQAETALFWSVAATVLLLFFLLKKYPLVM